jgi:hypothetical protein
MGCPELLEPEFQFSEGGDVDIFGELADIG